MIYAWQSQWVGSMSWDYEAEYKNEKARMAAAEKFLGELQTG